MIYVLAVRRRKLCQFCLFLLSLLSSVALAQDRTGVAPSTDIPSPIFDYMSRPEPDYDWKLAETMSVMGSKVYRLELTSQKWHDIVWKHALIVYEPSVLKYKEHMLLFVTGGNNGKIPQEKDLLMGRMIAEYCGARIATLHQVPNQPLMNNRKEDDLITETWLKYLETQDPTWPLLFPMVKSAVKAMDALEAFSKDKFNQNIEGFVISGASKRGWTSWLTPVVDERIVATAPIVIDMLNFPVQITTQKENWGKYSEQIIDYTSKGLVADDGIPRSGPEAELWKMMDPYTYRKQLSLPKLLVVGANDPYWNVDAMSLYWSDLVGSKHIMRVPNAGHSLDEGRDHAMRTIGVFFRHSITGKSLPELSWQPTVSDTNINLSIKATPAPKESRLWIATSEDKDFRDERWNAKPMNKSATGCSGDVPCSQSERVAVFGEVDYEFEGLFYSLSTLVYWK
jgi:PhoPQ-activated pathogenicity-related protein